MAKELKSRGYADTNKLKELFVLNEANGFDVPADVYNTLVLEPAGITLDQEKKRVKLEGEMLTGGLLVGGEQVADRFKTDANLQEVSMSIPMGPNRTATAIFGRGVETVVAIQTKIDTAEMKRVLAHVNHLFEDVSN